MRRSTPARSSGVCSYHRLDFDLVVVHTPPDDMQRAREPLQTAFGTLPVAKLGILDRLPAELVSMVLRHYIRSFFAFRQVNRRARVLATELWQYKLVSQHGLEGLRALLRAELAHRFTIDDLYRPLITDRCSTCGGFGGLLFLLTAERCCVKCLQSSAHYRVIPPSTFAKLANISPGRLKRLSGAGLRTVRGIYNMMKRPPRRPMHLISEGKTVQTLLDLGVMGEDQMQNLRDWSEQTDQRFMAATAYGSYNLENGILERGVSCKGCQIRLEHHYDDLDARDNCFSAQDFLPHDSYNVVYVQKAAVDISSHHVHLGRLIGARDTHDDSRAVF